MIPESLLADDKELEQIAMHPGDEVMCLGYPLSQALPGGGAFPILRSGRIASYPIFPAKVAKTILVDIPLYPGNSGGPAYFSSGPRQVKNSLMMSSFFGIIGQVTQVAEPLPDYPTKPMNIAVVVPSHFIKETMTLLPAPKREAPTPMNVTQR